MSNTLGTANGSALMQKNPVDENQMDSSTG